MISETSEVYPQHTLIPNAHYPATVHHSLTGLAESTVELHLKLCEVD